jgi:transcriptional antiterminator RfaH
MTYPRAQLILLETPLWFCLKAHPKREHLAAAALRCQWGITCFCPRLRFRKVTRRGTIWFVEAMFPGYLFARFVYAHQHRAIEHASGVQSIVQFGDQVAAVDTDTIAFLQQSAGEQELVTIQPEIRVGQSVQVTDGPLRGLEALVVQLLPARERVRVLLEFLGRPVAMEVPLPKVLGIRQNT